MTTFKNSFELRCTPKASRRGEIDFSCDLYHRGGTETTRNTTLVQLGHGTVSSDPRKAALSARLSGATFTVYLTDGTSCRVSGDVIDCKKP